MFNSSSSILSSPPSGYLLHLSTSSNSLRHHHSNFSIPYRLYHLIYLIQDLSTFSNMFSPTLIFSNPPISCEASTRKKKYLTRSESPTKFFIFLEITHDKIWYSRETDSISIQISKFMSPFLFLFFNNNNRKGLGKKVVWKPKMSWL